MKRIILLQKFKIFPISGLCKEFSKNGYKIYATCRSPEKATDLQAFLKSQGHLPALTLDIASKTSIEAYKTSISGLSKLDLLINNAGISNANHPNDPASTCQAQEFDQVMHTNVTGSLMVTQAFIPLLSKADFPKVVNISSALGSCTGLASYSSEPKFLTTSYQCSKAALNMLTKCLADDMKNITFLAVHPGWVQTDMGSSNNRNPPVTIEDSAQGIFKVVEEMQVKQSGGFVNFDGKVLPY